MAHAVWEQQKVPCFGLPKPNNWSHLAGDEGGGIGGRRGEVAHGGKGGDGGEQIWLVTRGGGGWGEAWEGGPWRAGKGGDGGGAPESSVGATKNLTGLIWLVTRVGGWGEAWGGGPWRAGKGGDGGGHQRAVWKQQKMHWFFFLGLLLNLTTGLIWLVTRVGGWGEAWGGGPWGEAWGGGGAVWEQQRCTGSSFWAPLKTQQLL